MKFEWDQRTTTANRRKHGVSFGEAAPVFADAIAVTFAHPDHAVGQERWLTFGTSRTGRLLVVSHVEGEVRMSDHGHDELVEDRLFVRDIVAGVSAGSVREAGDWRRTIAAD